MLFKLAINLRKLKQQQQQIACSVRSLLLIFCLQNNKLNFVDRENSQTVDNQNLIFICLPFRNELLFVQYDLQCTFSVKRVEIDENFAS